jgi:haloalkane dehalogenase
MVPSLLWHGKYNHKSVTPGHPSLPVANVAEHNPAICNCNAINMISDKEHEKQFIEVNGKRMAYVEMGDGDPIVFQHGNPTSSYLWRNIMPTLASKGRCIAVDLIGMGDSDKLDDPGPNRYRYVEHRDYLFAAWEALGVAENVTFVIHDWGSALGFDWASRNPTKVRGIAYMEAIVCPMSWDDWPEAARSVFQGFRSEAGEDMVLEKNIFVERVLPGSIIRDLTEEEMAVYRRPYRAPGEDRRPTLTWPRQIPIDGTPADVHDIVAGYADWLQGSDVPKLFINAEPGAILTGPQREFCRQFPNQCEVTVTGAHFIQEDSPHEITAAIRSWLDDSG